MKHGNHHIDDYYIISLWNRLGVEIDSSSIQKSLDGKKLLLDKIVKVPQIFSRLLLKLEE